MKLFVAFSVFLLCVPLHAQGELGLQSTVHYQNQEGWGFPVQANVLWQPFWGIDETNSLNGKILAQASYDTASGLPGLLDYTLASGLAWDYRKSWYALRPSLSAAFGAQGYETVHLFPATRLLSDCELSFYGSRMQGSLTPRVQLDVDSGADVKTSLGLRTEISWLLGNWIAGVKAGGSFTLDHAKLYGTAIESSVKVDYLPHEAYQLNVNLGLAWVQNKATASDPVLGNILSESGLGVIANLSVILLASDSLSLDFGLPLSWTLFRHDAVVNGADSGSREWDGLATPSAKAQLYLNGSNRLSAALEFPLGLSNADAAKILGATFRLGYALNF